MISYSVVIPVYNVEKFLAQCLDSVLNQTIPPQEVITVNDGSTDKSPEILADYASRYPQIKVIHHEKNAGMSVARNTGMKHATGDYLIFVDSDDYMDSDFYPRLLQMAEKDQLDVAIGNGYFYYQDSDRKPEVIFPFADEPLAVGEEWMAKQLLTKRFVHLLYLQVYRRALLQKVNVQFVPGRRHQDVVWMTQVVLAAKRVGYISTPGYYYRQWSGNVSRPKTDAVHVAIAESSVANAKDLADILCKPNLQPATRYALKFLLVDGGFSVFHKLSRVKDKIARKQAMKWVLNQGFFSCLWRHCISFNQRRKVIKYFVKYYLATMI
jgi:glycosyltransferase involved in cell wall biosynthesis